MLDMSTERNKNPLKRDQALNDATNGQLGEQSRPKPLGRGEFSYTRKPLILGR